MSFNGPLLTLLYPLAVFPSDCSFTQGPVSLLPHYDTTQPCQPTPTKYHGSNDILDIPRGRLPHRGLLFPKPLQAWIARAVNSMQDTYTSMGFYKLQNHLLLFALLHCHLKVNSAWGKETYNCYIRSFKWVGINFLFLFFVFLFQSILHSLFLASLFISCCIVYSQWVDYPVVQCVKVSVIYYHSHLHGTPNLETIPSTKPTPD